jgi:hypothetical protein
MTMERWLLLLPLLILWVASTGQAKEGRSYYTPERIEAARANVASYEWAQKKQALIMDEPPPEKEYHLEGYVGARRQVKLSDEQLFAMMPPITIGRKWNTNPTATCPVHGTEIKKFSGFYPWRFDFENHPYKVICPVGKEMYPSNDFAAGDLTSGEYPDDGTGCQIGDQRFQFINYWAHGAYLNWVRPTISCLAEAYLLTDEPQYAHKAAVLLAAVANQYPGPKYNSEYCHGGSYGARSGAVTDYIWECILIPKLALAYDAIWPIYDQSPELLTFLQSKGLPAQSAAEARQFVEEHLFRQAMQGLLDGALQGNPGHHQEAAAVLALVMDDYSEQRPNSRDMMHFAYYSGYAPTGWVMSNYLTRDGGGFEGPGYDRIKLNYVRVAELMEELRQRRPDQYPESEFPQVMQEPKARAMFDFFSEILSLDYYTPEVGDAGGGWLAGRLTTPQYLSTIPADCVKGFRLYQDPRLARAALGVKDSMPGGLDLYAPSPEEELRAAAALPEAQINLGTRLLDGYGFAYLHSGQGINRREATVNYTALMGHSQDDYLSLQLFADEIAYLPDLGYPYTWDYRNQWDSNMYTHNTTVVDGCKPLGTAQVAPGWVSLLGDAGWVQAVAVAHQPYQHHPTIAPEQPPVNRYERICVMVEESPQQFYLLDLFVVQGGQRHDQSWHSILTPPALPELPWVDQPTGTAAGPEVPFDGKYVNLQGVETQDGLCYVTGVKRAPLSSATTFHWEFPQQMGGLRMHLAPVDGPAELIYGHGRSPARPESWQLPLLFVRREGADENLTSRFLTVLEPYRDDGTPRLTSVEVSGEWPLEVKVQRGETVDEITIYAPCGPEGLQRGEARQIGVAVRTVAAGETVREAQFGQLAEDQSGLRRGQITAVDRAANTITLDAPLPPGTNWLRLHSPGRSSMYRVLEARQVGTQAEVVLKESSLLARGLPVGYQLGIIENDAPIPFATFPIKGTKERPLFTDRFRGARVETEDGSTSLRLGGIEGRNWINGVADYDLYLEDQIDAEELENLFGSPGQAPRFAVYDYGTGDRWEVAVSRSR